MATVLSTLYPPLIDTFMPAFPKNQDAIVNFSISPYNSNDYISKLHVSIVDQRTNLSVLKSNGWLDSNPSNGCFINGVWILEEGENWQINTNNNTCKLIIPKEALKNNEFNTSNYYKIQLRFSEDTDEINTILTNNYLTTKRSYFSEWSSICLIKAIPEISLQITGYDSSNTAVNLEETSKNNPKNFPAGIIPIAGNVQFSLDDTSNTENDLTNLNKNQRISTKNEETLKSYQITVLNDENEEVLLESDTIYTYNNEDPNRIYWLADLTNVEANVLCKIVINCITKNQYEFSFTYYIKISQFLDRPFTPTWTFGDKIYDSNFKEICLCPDLQEDGQLKISVTYTPTLEEESLGPGYLYIKRATSLDNFKHWEIIRCKKISEDTISDTFVDTTLGSLVRYKYSCQFHQYEALWTNTNISPEIIYPEFYDILLSRGDKQLAIRYNGQISSITPVVNRIKIDTLGGKYPKFAENAKMNYKQFQISGMIIAESDYNRKFLNNINYFEDMAIYDERLNGQYIVRNDTLPDLITQKEVDDYPNIIPVKDDKYPMNNWWWERLFREEATKWLNDGEPKLFRSMPEGNMVVMLTDISLTPNTQVGRRTYNFSATAYEIADGYSLNTLTELKIWDPNNDNESNDNTEEETPFQLQSIMKLSQSLNVKRNSNEDDGILEEISSFYSNYHLGINPEWRITPKSYVLENVKIQFTSKPKWYNISSDAVITENSTNKNNAALGYYFDLIIEEDGKWSTITIFVNERGYYQIPSNIKVKDIKLREGDIATLDYILNYSIEYDRTTTIKNQEVVKSIVGQLRGLWYPNQKLKQKIISKYNYTERDKDSNNIAETQSFENWTGISFDLAPYTVISIKVKNENESDYLIGRTGILDLMKNILLEEVTIRGRRMFKVFDTGSEKDTSKKYYPDEWEFTIADENEDITNPQYNRVYTINNKQKIYYIDDQWYDFEISNNNEIGLAKVPINGMINYKGDIVKKTYS